uniref:Uncharacterized protein n=1 Tax=Ditylenchus dipsaci TaxID=166011 RepID=A0A915DNT4_9BILA
MISSKGKCSTLNGTSKFEFGRAKEIKFLDYFVKVTFSKNTLRFISLISAAWIGGLTEPLFAVKLWNCFEQNCFDKKEVKNDQLTRSLAQFPSLFSGYSKRDRNLSSGNG